MTAEQQIPAALTVLVYSDDRTTREAVKLALGTRVAADLPTLEIVECATHQALTKEVVAGGIDLLVLDGEAVPLGGMGAARQLKDEVPGCPPVVLLIAREADAWLASWSRAEGVSAYPVDPIRLPATVAQVLREHVVKA